MTTKELDAKYVAATYKRFPVEIARGKGSEVFDETGKRYIDLGSGIAVTSFGVADGEWMRAVTEQMSRVQHMSNLYYTAPCASLAKMLCERTGMKKVFFSNSGAEANECAIKAARKYAADKYGPDRYTIVTLKNSFHGRTITTLSATGQEHYHEQFRPMTPGFMHVEAGDIAALEALNRPCDVDLFSDSQYLVKAFRDGWIGNWQHNGWKTSGKDPVKNRDLWERLLELTKTHRVTFHWVKGHDGHPENERCDRLATAAADAMRGDSV